MFSGAPRSCPGRQRYGPVQTRSAPANRFFDFLYGYPSHMEPEAPSDELQRQTSAPPAGKSRSRKAQALLEALSALLFLTQVVHLVWMTTYVIPMKLWDTAWWSPPEAPLALADYLELPAIFTTSILYLRTRNWKLLFLVNVQLLHIFWITDEIILNRSTLNPLLAWLAVMIDYLEIPVIIDTTRKFLRRAFGRTPGLKPAAR
jgi:hypothetical protein